MQRHHAGTADCLLEAVKTCFLPPVAPDVAIVLVKLPFHSYAAATPARSDLRFVRIGLGADVQFELVLNRLILSASAAGNTFTPGASPIQADGGRSVECPDGCVENH